MQKITNQNPNIAAFFIKKYKKKPDFSLFLRKTDLHKRFRLSDNSCKKHESTPYQVH